MPRIVVAILFLLLLPASAGAQAPAAGGNACVVAKKLGNSLAIEWALGQPTVSAAIARASEALRRRGYEYVFPQANSPLPHGWLVVIETSYTTYTGRKRTSYGCGFAADAAGAEQQAVRDLRAYSWGWKPDYGYQVKERLRF